jgi:hypothetical protein
VIGKVKTVSVKREGGKWFVVLTAEQARPDPLPPTGSVVGIDLGIATEIPGVMSRRCMGPELRFCLTVRRHHAEIISNFLADSNGGFVHSPLNKTIACYGRVDLLCIDEPGYMALDRHGVELLFQVLTEREEEEQRRHRLQ